MRDALKAPYTHAHTLRASLYNTEMNLHTFLLVLGCCAFTTDALDTFQRPPGLRGPLGEQGQQGVEGPLGPHINTAGQQSAFFALFGSIPSTSNVVVFTQAFYNGQNHYDSRTGVFLCNVPGVYQFQFSCKGTQSLAVVTLMRNHVVQIQSETVSINQQILAEGLAILRLEKGDRVWIEALQGANGISRASYFTGHLLFPV